MKRAIQMMCVALPVSGSPVQAEELFTHSWGSSGGFAAYGPAAYGTLRLGNTQGTPWETVFGNLQLTPADMGTTFTADAGSDASFGATAAFFTNGDDDVVTAAWDVTSTGGGGGGGHKYWQESTDLFGASGTPNGIDLQGYRIDSFDLTVDSLSFAPLQGSPDEWLWTSYAYNLTWRINGLERFSKIPS